MFLSRLRSSSPPGVIIASFALLGAFWGCWAMSLPNIQRDFKLSNSALGVVLAVSVGAAGFAGAVVGRLARRFGSLHLLGAIVLIWALTAVPPSFTHSVILFTVAYSFAQISAGCVDAAMNAPATVFYKDRAGSLVSFHSIFNIGALVGALFSALAIANGISWRWLWPTVAVLAALTALTARLGAPGDILDADQVPHAIVLTPVGESPSAPREKTRSLRHDGLLVFLIVFALAEVTEGGAFTWGVLYLRHFLRAGIYVGAIAYIIGHVVAALSRGVGGTKMRSIPVGRAFVFGSLLCAAGLCIEVATRISIIAAVGLALATAGTSLFWPLVMSSIASRSSSPGRAVGSFTAAGYVGWVAGAPLIGYMSDALGPKAGLLSMAVICVIVIVAVLAGALPTNQDHAQSAGKVSS